MRVLHLIPALDIGGTEKILLNIAKRQIEIGYKVKIVVFFRSENEMPRDKDLDVDYIENTSFERRLLKPSIVNIDKYDAMISLFNPSIIHSHTYFTDLIMLHAKKISAKLISHLHLKRTILEPNPIGLNVKAYLKSMLDKIWFEKLLKKSNVTLISISSYSTKYHKQLLTEAVGNQIITLKNALEFPTFFPPRKLDLNNKQNVIKLVTVGRLVDEKNHQFLIEVIRALKSSPFKFTLDIYGEGDKKEFLSSLINTYSLTNVVSIKGNNANIISALTSYDLYVHSSKKELFGLSILEALHCSLPCIALNYEAVGELICNNYTGRLIDTENVSHFTDAIISTISNPEIYFSYSKNAVAFSQTFSFDNYLRNLDLIYKGDYKPASC